MASSRKNVPAHDPNRDLEAARYDNPIASREFILATLARAGVPLSLEDLAARLDLADEDRREALRRRLRAMERDGQLMMNRRGAWCSVERMDLVRGTVQATRDGYGFLVPADGGEDLYLHGRQMRQVFHGDEVLAQAGAEAYRGRREATIVEVLKRNTPRLVGRIRRARGMSFVLAENPRIQHEVMVADPDSLDAREGQYVTVEIIDPPSLAAPPTGRVVEVLGDHMAPGMEIEVALRSHGIPHLWPQPVLEEAAAFAPEPRPADKAKRLDLRDTPLVTIDGEDAKDFDDAVFCERRGKTGWRLLVAIADVSHYVKPGTPLDAEARTRGTSVYFPGRVVPMLPEELSNGLCSLKPEVDRLALVCEMEISRAGEIGRFRFAEAVIRSHARLTYTRVAATLAGEDAGVPVELEPHLRELYALFGALRAARELRGAIDFETTETRIVFGPDRKIEEVVPVERNDAHKLIEECMLAANVAAARFLAKHKVPALYRVHEGPGGEKLKSLRRFLGELGLSLRGGDTPQPGDYQELIAAVADRPDRHVIQTVMLRSLSQARYQPDNAGHFGLNYTGYAHFTSPIRRYPDLMVHRAIRAVIRSDEPSTLVLRDERVKPEPRARLYPYDLHAVGELGEYCSMAERRADDAVRDVMAWLKCEYLQDRVGDEFPGVVSGVTGFGLFVELGEVYADGLVHVSSLQNDYYHFDAPGHRLVGERTRRAYRLGDRLRVRILRVGLDDRKIDLEIVDGAATGRAGAAPAKGGRRDEPRKSEPRRGEPKRPEPRKTEPRRVETAVGLKADPRRGGESRKPEPRASEPRRPEPRKPEPRKPEPRKPEPRKAEVPAGSKANPRGVERRKGEPRSTDRRKVSTPPPAVGRASARQPAAPPAPVPAVGRASARQAAAPSAPPPAAARASTPKPAPVAAQPARKPASLADPQPTRRGGGGLSRGPLGRRR